MNWSEVASIQLTYWLSLEPACSFHIIVHDVLGLNSGAFALAITITKVIDVNDYLMVWVQVDNMRVVLVIGSKCDGTDDWCEHGGGKSVTYHLVLV